jgi:hypothetical protein
MATAITFFYGDVVEKKKVMAAPTIAFFFMFEKTKTMALCRHLLLWFYYSEKR